LKAAVSANSSKSRANHQRRGGLAGQRITPRRHWPSLASSPKAPVKARNAARWSFTADSVGKAAWRKASVNSGWRLAN